MLDYSKKLECIVDDIINNLTKIEKKKLLHHSNYNDYHFGFGLYIRNHYIYNHFDLNMIEPDDLSEEIFNRVVEKLKVEKNRNNVVKSILRKLVKYEKN